ncbi:Osmoregulated proline transporter OpuE [subsurface metagenome]
MTEKYIAIGIYLVILTLITWLSARRKNVGDFLFASHDVGWKNLSISIFASVISSYNVVLTLTFAFLFGPYILLVFLGSLAAFLGIYFIAKKYQAIIQEHSFNNIIDFFAHKFDSKTATTLNLAFILVLFIFIILQLFINTSVFSELMGWNKYVSSIFVGAIVLAYTTIGGLKAEIYTDIFQGILMFLVIALVFMVDTSVITAETVGAILSDKTILVGAICLSAAQFLTLLVQPEMWQRVAAARSIRNIKKGFIVSWVLLTLFIIPEILIGLSARASGEIEDPSNLFYDILATSAPAWFLPFLAVGLFAAFMSTLDSSLFAISSQLGKYGFIVKKKEHEEKSAPVRDRQVARSTRISIVIVAVLALILSLFFANFLSAVFGLISLLTVISVAVLLSLIFKLSSNETFAAILVGIAAFAFALFGGFITQEPITSLYPSFALVGYMIVQTFVVRGYRRFQTGATGTG